MADVTYLTAQIQHSSTYSSPYLSVILWTKYNYSALCSMY
jgi:hypothetical protein